MDQNALMRVAQRISESVWLDVAGVGVVVASSIGLGYHETVINGWPIGWFSTVGVAVSMLATRFVTRRNNVGNAIGLAATVNSAFVDYALGNKAAFLTYPITFLGNAVSVWYWSRRKDRTPSPVNARYFRNIVLAVVLGTVLNYAGYSNFWASPLATEDFSKFLLTSAITGLAFSGLFNTPALYADSWFFWQVYNVLKLVQNWHFGNIAYVAKYVFYLFNSALAWIVWRFLMKRPRPERI
jgi:hypothetical protein